ncbi:IGP family C type lectin domain [Trypanosoma vivax]|nr:IGP family C type lectin domain [Trypanosoma vivax]KAH8617324.1 IGP family C type lectin domain [Trypanosoma vivax]
MTTDARARTAACVRTAGAWPLLLLLCVHVAWHARLASAEDGRVTVNVKRYLSLPSEGFRTQHAHRVDYSSSDRLCREAGAVLAADQSRAAHEAILEQFHVLSVKSVGYSFLGGDALSNAAMRRNPLERCKAGDKTTSLNCVYRWNKGLFAAASNGDGAAFWRGSLRGVSGSAALNGYPSHWSELYPKDSYLNVVAWYLPDKYAVYWRDVNSDQPYFAPTPILYTYVTNYIAVCEVQDSVSTTGTGNGESASLASGAKLPFTSTNDAGGNILIPNSSPSSSTNNAPVSSTLTAMPTVDEASLAASGGGSNGTNGAGHHPTGSAVTAVTATKPPPPTSAPDVSEWVSSATFVPPVPGAKGQVGRDASSTWAERYWYVILLSLLVAIAAVVLIVLCLCLRCCAGDGEKVTPMVLRESAGAPLCVVAPVGDGDAYYADVPPFVPSHADGMWLPQC